MLLTYLIIPFSILQCVSSKQIYDPKPCAYNGLSPVSRYTCNSSKSCETYIVYRSQQGFETVREISALFGVNQDQILLDNNITDPTKILETNCEVLIRVECHCLGSFFQSNASYSILKGGTYKIIACDIFEGLVKEQTLAKENSFDAANLKVGAKLAVPLTCACLDLNDTRDGFQYLVTYPIFENDDTDLLAEKFGVSPVDIRVQNSLDPNLTIYASTTILIPLHSVSSINFTIIDSSSRYHDPIPMNSTKQFEEKDSKKYLVAIILGIGALSLFLAIVVFRLYYRGKHKWINKLDLLSSNQSSTPSCLSPDLVAGVAKYSLISYSFGELTEATKGFSEETELGAYVHKGRIGDRDVVVKKMSSFDAQRIISVYSKINHTNIISLQGVCYGVTDPSSPTSLSTSSYLVFEFARNGSLRDCLRSHSEVLPWDRRIQIAFDVATALHYIHHCTVTSYIHMNISSENILITKDWRAKIANLGVGTSDGSVSTKVDVFGFGLVLLELLCSEEVGDGIHVREKLRVLNEKGSDQNGCFEELREFMDQSLEDYPIEEALCMVVLAMACLEDETTNRPSMHDILKIIARIAR
uniref:Protein kinase domain-containing protein n=1 Tax=Ananas comosus var. bracteatus TaxID=296719 RepID=A0A6V7QLR0_ANACO|nr:unnamed protein product [Ananas comosus var. bracteatus]